jgi:hypothetical protein
MSLIIATVLLQFAIIYTFQVRSSAPQTHQVDERIRLRYLAHGMTELALLKFQKFPSEFYNAWEYASATNDLSVWKDLTINADEFSELDDDKDQPESTFNDFPIEIGLATMSLETSDRWGVEVLKIRTAAKYESRRNLTFEADAVRTVRTQRETSKVIPDP